MLDSEGQQYSNYSSWKSYTPTQLQNMLSLPQTTSNEQYEQQLVNIILQEQANTQQMNLIQTQITALQN